MDRKTATVITDNLAVGSFAKAQEMQAQGWKVICVASGDDVVPCDLNLPMIDGHGNNRDTIKQALDWVLEQWRNQIKVYVCCRNGMNRSVLVASAALCLAERCEWLGNALLLIASKRPIVSPRDDTLSEVLAVLLETRGFRPCHKG